MIAASICKSWAKNAGARCRKSKAISRRKWIMDIECKQVADGEKQIRFLFFGK